MDQGPDANASIERSGTTEEAVDAPQRSSRRAPRGRSYLDDPRALTILATEHQGLMTARSLVYNEAFARSGMFLTFLTGSLVALGFVSSASGFGKEFLVVASALLAADVVIGLATLGRISYASAEEFRTLQGMARVRHAYLEMVPELEPYLSASKHDDLAGVLEVYGVQTTSIVGEILHGLTTAPALVAMITALAAGGFAAVLSLTFDAPPVVAIVAGFVAIAAVIVFMAYLGARTVGMVGDALEVRFPRPPTDTDQ